MAAPEDVAAAPVELTMLVVLDADEADIDGFALNAFWSVTTADTPVAFIHGEPIVEFVPATKLTAAH